ncbi:MAG: tetratricopeptide repeat protein, partial [Cyanobacteriota bacterium]|nr:tetratricopeptide repeat protein [Cyanobacteriota bacterium]
MMKLHFSVQQLHQQAQHSLSQEQYSKAIVICKQALTLQPDSKIASEIYKVLGIASQMQGEVEKAFQFYLKSLELKPDDAEIYHNIGSLYARKKQWQDAILSYQAALNLDPKLESAYLNLGNARIKLSLFDDAIAYYHQLIKFNPNLALAYQKLGDIFFQLQQWDEAISAFNHVIELNPNSAWSYQHLGKIYIYKQQWENAIQACIQAIKINPKAAWSYNNLGDILSKQEYWNQAALAYLHAIKVRENPYKFGFLNTIYQRLGYVIRQQIKQSSFERVANRYAQFFQQKEEKYLSDYPFNIAELGFTTNTLEPYLQIAEVFVQCQQFEAALIFYRLALDIQPNELEIYIKVIKTYNQ